MVATTTCCDPFPSLDTGDIWAMKYDGLSGRELWTSPFDYDDPDHLTDVPLEALIDHAGDVVVSATSNRGVPGPPPGKHVTLKIDGRKGTLAWAKTVISDFAATALDGSGNVFVAYSDYPSGSPAALEYAVLDGNVLWGPVTTSGFGLPTVSAVDANGDLYVASFFQTPGYGFEVTKYNGRTGAVLWGPVQQATSADGQPIAIEVGAGTVVVAAMPGILVDYAADSGHVVWGPVVAAGASGLSAALSIAAGGDVLFTSAAGEALATWRYAGPTGSLIWGPASVPETSSLDAPIAFLASNGRVVTAVQDSHSKVFERDGSTGSIAWGPTDFLGLADGDARINDLGTGPDGNPLVALNLAGSNGTGSIGIIKYDRSTGAVIWGPTIFATGGFFGALYPFQVLGDRSNNVLVAGLDTILKLDGATGALLWQSPQIPSPTRIALDASGDILAIGSADGSVASDFATVKISGASGHILWGPVLFDNSAADNRVQSLGVDAAGDVIVTGNSTDLQTYAASISTLKYSGKTGALLWGPVLLPDGTVDDLALDSAGNAVIVGQLKTDMLTIEYSRATGAVLWGPKLVNGSGDYYDAATRVAISPGGDVFVTGYAYSSSGTDDWATLKYRGSDGAVLWGPILLPAVQPHGANTPNAIGLDPSGNVVVAGTVADSQNNSDSATIKYDGSTGAVLWGPLLGGLRGLVEVNGLSVAAGSVVIAGRSAQSAFTRAYNEDGIATAPVHVPRSVLIVPFRGP